MEKNNTKNPRNLYYGNARVIEIGWNNDRLWVIYDEEAKMENKLESTEEDEPEPDLPDSYNQEVFIQSWDGYKIDATKALPVGITKDSLILDVLETGGITVKRPSDDTE